MHPTGVARNCVGADPSAGGPRVKAPAPNGVESVPKAILPRVGMNLPQHKSEEGCPLFSRLGELGSVVSSPSGARGEAPTANVFSAYSRPQNASNKKMRL